MLRTLGGRPSSGAPRISVPGPTRGPATRRGARPAALVALLPKKGQPPHVGDRKESLGETDRLRRAAGGPSRRVPAVSTAPVSQPVSLGPEQGRLPRRGASGLLPCDRGAHVRLTGMHRSVAGVHQAWSRPRASFARLPGHLARRIAVKASPCDSAWQSAGLALGIDAEGYVTIQSPGRAPEHLVSLVNAARERGLQLPLALSFPKVLP